MNSISTINREFNGKKITQREDGYLDATAMCKATSKQFKHYLENQSTRDFLKALSGSVGIPTDLLIQKITTGSNENRGSWVHPQIAINLAQWCSPQFAVIVSKWVFELMTTGHVELQRIGQNTLESEIILAKATAEMLRMSNDSKLKMLYQISEGHNLSTTFLPDYTESRQTKALTVLLKEHGSKITIHSANKILIELGVLEEKQRPSSSKGVKKFKSLTEEGLFYGKNLVSPNNPRETQPHYYIDKFQELLDRMDSFLPKI